MRREIELLKNGVSGCCPGHDDYPNDTYKSRRSIKASSRDKKKEHKYARTLNKRNLAKELNEDQYDELQQWCNNSGIEWATEIGHLETVDSIVNEAISNGNIHDK